MRHEIVQAGVGVNDLVGLCIQRSVELLIGLLGILKSGAAYLPLDHRIILMNDCFYMLESANVEILLTESTFKNVCNRFECQRICIEQILMKPKPAAFATRFEYAVALLATIWPMSFSHPALLESRKGVQITHAALANFLTSMA